MNSCKTKKLFAVWMACVILFILLGSNTFIACHMNHVCIGKECPVCEELQMAQNTITNLGAIIVYVAVALFLCAFAQTFAQVYHTILRKNTLVRLKVELLD